MLPVLMVLAALPSVISSLSSTHSRQRRVVQQPGLIRFPITVSEAPRGASRRVRRQNTAGLASRSTGFFYTIDIVIGTPGQAVPVSFDTGSWELWVNPSCSNSTEKEICESLPRFTQSSTLVDTNLTGEVRYSAGYAKFKYVSDHVAVGEAKLDQQVFGVAYDTSVFAYGIFGAGPSAQGWESAFPHVLDSLVSQKHMQSRAFSLDIRPIDSPLGAVIFGGIDTRKYTGPLEKRPVTTGPNGSVGYWIFLDGLSVSREDGSRIPVFDQTAEPLRALLDSGNTLTHLPRSMVTEILKAFPSARQDPNDAKQYIVDCAAASLAGTVDFQFGSTTIRVPYDDFLWKQPQHNICVLGVSPDDSFFVLGDTFLRAAYAVYDMDNRNVYVASAADCGTHLVPIGRGENAVPVLDGECPPRVTSAKASTASSPVQPTTRPIVKTTAASSNVSAAPSSSSVASAPVSAATTSLGSSLAASFEM
ncbi:secreted aspartic proteinase [Metarhizium album ARSEF 1941]|uniref:Secreted aspartic proteinase n=1 Tax=Metarhizium album (strain ARSEF 1941) TaxID=1081103 RepID=A0A0B2WPX3_METAS|nr:secreted aspartic proteinase [Metarhizium album ARSEF 1941]KHN95537.1 secreted aspartic proteinase [Metarhizium album ARSEF 1941]